MKSLLKTMEFKMLYMAAVASLLVVGATAAYAVPPIQVLLVQNAQTFTDPCCVLWNETVQISEPAAVAPVIVTWSVSYQNATSQYVGLSVNRGPCLFYGGNPLYPADNGAGPQTATFHWAAFPGDGPPGNQLRKGANTFTLCGGGTGIFNDGQPVTATILRNLLTVRLSQ